MSRTLTCLLHKKYPTVTQATKPLLCTLESNTLAQVQPSKERRRRRMKAVPSIRLDQRCRHLGNLTSPETKMAHQSYCRDVTVGVSSSSGLAPLLRRAAERWQEMPVSLELTRPHRCMDYAFNTSGVVIL